MFDPVIFIMRKGFGGAYRASVGRLYLFRYYSSLDGTWNKIIGSIGYFLTVVFIIFFVLSAIIFSLGYIVDGSPVSENYPAAWFSIISFSSFTITLILKIFALRKLKKMNAGKTTKEKRDG